MTIEKLISWSSSTYPTSINYMSTKIIHIKMEVNLIKKSSSRLLFYQVSASIHPNWGKWKKPNKDIFFPNLIWWGQIKCQNISPMSAVFLQDALLQCYMGWKYLWKPTVTKEKLKYICKEKSQNPAKNNSWYWENNLTLGPDFFCLVIRSSMYIWNVMCN